jgi:hypothetical protein
MGHVATRSSTVPDSQRSAPVQPERSRSTPWRRHFLSCHLPVAVVVVILLVSVLFLNAGRFTYTLDDSYITLALSQHIADGEYGLNNGEFSAPSSTIIYPFILAAGTKLPIYEYLPLLMNIGCLFITLEILYSFLLRIGFDCDRMAQTIAAFLIAVAALSFNIIGLMFSGMEHNLHIAVAAGTILGLAVFLEERQLRWWVVPLIVAGPFIRYEGLSLSLACCAVIGLAGKRWAAIAGAAFILVLLIGFSLFLVSHGVGPMPSSILSKSEIITDSIEHPFRVTMLSMVLSHIFQMLRDPVGMVMALAAVAALALLWSKRKDFLTFRDRLSAELGLAVVLIAVVSGHAVAGEFGWFCRYEIYAVIITFMTSIFLVSNPIRGVLARPGGHLTVLLGGAALLITIGSRYIIATTQVPIAANNTYEQQYQMHRFLTEFHTGPAAVNDLGWTSYRNSNYVLDLTGLGFDQARILRRNHASADAFDRLVRMKGVDLAIVYTDWFKGQIPSNWTLLARMSLSRRRITAAEDVVDFYATDAIYVDQIGEELRNFSRALPAPIRLEMVEKAASMNSR